MLRPPILPSRRAAGRVLAAATAAAVLALLGQLPVTSAAFRSATQSSGNSFTAAPSFCSSPGSATTDVANDSMVVQSDPTGNYGSTAPVQVRARTGDARRTFVRPALPAIPAGCQVVSASLRFVVQAHHPRTLHVLRVGGSWNVNSLTWANQPPAIGSPVVSTVTSGTWTVDVTPLVPGLYAGPNDGLVVLDANESTPATFTNAFRGIDDGSPARLTVTWG